MADDLGKNGGSSWSGEFGGDIDLPEGNPAEDFRGGGSGKGEVAVGAMNGASALDRDRGGDIPDAEMV